MDRGFATSTSTSNDELKVSPTTTQQMPPGTFAPQITKPWCEALVELSQPSATDACLDLASGGGVNAFVIADAIEEAKLWGPPAGAGALGGAHNLAGSVLGLDRSREALSKAKEALKAKQLKGEGSVPVRFEWADAVDKDSPWHETKKKTLRASILRQRNAILSEPGRGVQTSPRIFDPWRRFCRVSMGTVTAGNAAAVLFSVHGDG